jgi:hypothetical protein
MQLSSAVTTMLNSLKDVDKNAENYKMRCVRIVERLLVEQELPQPSTTDRQQRRIKFDSSCCACGSFLERGTVAWLTVGESPMCNDCRKACTEGL